MHTFQMEVDRKSVSINYNSDFSGDAIVYIRSDETTEVKEIELPAGVFVIMARMIVYRVLEDLLA